MVKVLGLSPGATSEQIQRAYNIKTRENRGNEEALSKIEAAHSSIMMSLLTSRLKVRLTVNALDHAWLGANDEYAIAACLQGGVKVDKDVLYADKAVFFPWRPR